VQIDARPLQQPQVGASQSGVERKHEERLAPLQALEGVRDVFALRVGRLMLALLAHGECGRGEVITESRFIVEGAEELLALADGEFVLHDRLGEQLELLYLLEEGVDIRYVQRLLGHRSIVTTEIYTHVADAAVKSRVIERHPRKSILGRT